MKNVSTAAGKQSRNISRPKLTIGLDLGDRNSWYCVLDEAGDIQLEQRVRTIGNGLREAFGGCDMRYQSWRFQDDRDADDTGVMVSVVGNPLERRERLVNGVQLISERCARPD